MYIFSTLYITDTRNEDLKGYLTRPKTKFQGKFLRAFFNVRLNSKIRNVMFVIFETNERLLFYHYYASKDDSHHSENYLLKDKDRIIDEIKKRLEDLRDYLEGVDCGMILTVLSKNATCDPCAITHEHIIKFRDEVDSKIHTDSDRQNIRKTEIQVLRVYERKEGGKTEKHTEGIKHLGDCDIHTKPLDWKIFYALYVQWCSTRENCAYIAIEPKTRPTDVKDCSNHNHEVDDALYRKVMKTAPGRVSQQQFKDEIVRLAIVESQEELKAQAKVESQEEVERKARKALVIKKFIENYDESDLEDSLSQCFGGGESDEFYETRTNSSGVSHSDG